MAFYPCKTLLHNFGQKNYRKSFLCKPNTFIMVKKKVKKKGKKRGYIEKQEVDTTIRPISEIEFDGI